MGHNIKLGHVMETRTMKEEVNPGQQHANLT